jgi:hypothetical protein
MKRFEEMVIFRIQDSNLEKIPFLLWKKVVNTKMA